VTQKDISNNPGILPIKLGNAKLQTSSHNFLHFFNVEPLFNEIKELTKHYEEIKNTVIDPYYQQTLNNHFRIIEHYIQTLNELTKLFQPETRQKRGLINGLGSIIKQITGNMDSHDEDKITEALKSIKLNQKNIAHQINHQYSINHEIIDKFNKTVENIQHNEKILYDRIDDLFQINYNNSKDLHQFLAESTLSQITNIFSIITNVFQNLKTSLTFCKLNMLHSDIIMENDLMKELVKINKIHEGKLPFEINHKTIQSFTLLIKPTCHIENYEIVFVLTLPLFSSKSFQLFYLLPVPNKHFQIILSPIKYVLKNQSEIIPLSSSCELTQKVYLCPQATRTLLDISCETNIINHNKVDNCSYVQLPEQKSLEYLPETNQYLAMFPHPTTIEKQCQDSWSKETIEGIFIFDFTPHCQVCIESKPLIFNDSTRTQAMPLQFHVNIPKREDHNLPKLHLRNLQVSKLHEDMQPFTPAYEESSLTWHTSSTAFLYVILIFFVAFMSYRRFQRPQQQSIREHRPEDARF